jgi:hypothetical protein
VKETDEESALRLRYSKGRLKSGDKCPQVLYVGKPIPGEAVPQDESPPIGYAHAEDATPTETGTPAFPTYGMRALPFRGQRCPLRSSGSQVRWA